MAGRSFLFPRKIYFGDCDLLGIAFTGRITNFAIEAIELFWEQLLDGYGWHFLLAEKGIAVPFVNLTINFTAPVKAASLLVCEVHVLKIGLSSVGLQVLGRQGQTECFDCRATSVFMDATDFVKIPISDNIRAALQCVAPVQSPCVDSANANIDEYGKQPPGGK